jgi:hypothetical protein
VISHVDSFSKIAVVLSNGIMNVDDPLLLLSVLVLLFGKHLIPRWYDLLEA